MPNPTKRDTADEIRERTARKINAVYEALRGKREITDSKSVSDQQRVKDPSPLKDPSPVKNVSPVKDTSPLRTPEIDALREMKNLAKFGFYALIRTLLPPDGGTVCVSDLARETGMSERTLQLHFAGLEETGWFRTVERMQDGKRIIFVGGEGCFTPKRSSSSLSLESKEKTTTVVTQLQRENTGEGCFTPEGSFTPENEKWLPSDREVIALSVLSSRKQRKDADSLNATVIEALSERIRSSGPVDAVALILEGTRPEVRDIASYIHGMFQRGPEPRKIHLQRAEKVLDNIRTLYAHIGYNVDCRDWIKAARTFGINVYPETEEEAKTAQKAVTDWARTFAAL